MIIRPLYPIYGRFPRKKHMQFLGFEKHFLKTEKYPIQPHLPTSELLIQQKDSPVTGGCPIWKIIHNTFNKDWLVVEPPTPLKNDGVSSSVGMIFHSQLNGKSFKIPWFQSPIRWISHEIPWPALHSYGISMDFPLCYQSVADFLAKPYRKPGFCYVKLRCLKMGQATPISSH